MRLIDRHGAEPDPAAQPRDSGEALAWLDAGNDRFSRLAAAGGQPGTDVAATLALDGDFAFGAALARQGGPQPFGIVLGCADASLPMEVLFGRTADDLFVVKLAGNTIGSDALASIEYAVDRFPTIQVAVVLGHTLCGAVAAAVETFLKRRGFAELVSSLPHRSLVDRIQVSTRAASTALHEVYGLPVADAPGYGSAMLDLAVFLNAAYVAYCLQSALPPETTNRVEVVYGVYDLATGRVCGGANAPAPFATSPDDAEGFRSLARTLAGSVRVRKLLQDLHN
jgi:carbonic anhydrase